MFPNKKVTKEIGIGGGANCFAKCALPLRTPSRGPNLQFQQSYQGKNVRIFALPQTINRPAGGKIEVQIEYYPGVSCDPPGLVI